MTAEPSWAVVGAGPHSLALVLALVARDPAWARHVSVLDPSGSWLSAWRDRFRAHEISRLRSASVHHPHPDPMRLRAHAIECDRDREFHEPYDLPGAGLFDDFCQHLLHDGGLTDLVEAAAVTEVLPAVSGVSLVLADGSQRQVDRVVLATNPVQRTLPSEIGDATVPWRHADDVVLPAEAGLAGRRIDVVGGGLTAVQLATGAAERGATVRLRCRRPLVERQFDVDPGWLGPRRLQRYRRCGQSARRRLVDAARGGGSVPPADLRRLAELDLRPMVHPDAAGRALSGDADEVWLATGHRLNADTDPLLAGLRSYSPTPVHDGVPVLDAHLAWPGTTVHLMGGYAALTLGPASRNLWGARFGAERVAGIAGSSGSG